MNLNTLISPDLKTLNVTVPKLEGTVALNLFLIKYGLDFNRLLFFKDIKSYIESYNNGMIALPNAYFFDEYGNELALNQEAMLNEDDAFAFKLARLIEDAKAYNVNIEFYLLNCDMLRHWDYSEYKMKSEKK
ncbi:hypothetical protein [uncultured Winogradskyella sp.]|uniref:hypothetical protein n=1 Tax=uncultured Winogradskyella sp. TaxID=395353 RepID=UPI0026332AB7|nr:hypothetical protein [uncultured Winogradskyella sp.]